MKLKWKISHLDTFYWDIKRISPTHWQTRSLGCINNPNYVLHAAPWEDSLVGGNIKFVEKLYRAYHDMPDIAYEQYYKPDLLFKFKSLDSRSYEIKKELEELLYKTAKEFLSSIES